MADKYTLRRTIMQAILDAEPVAATFEDVMEAAAIAMNPVLTRELVAGELAGLVATEYVADLRPGREPLYRLSLAGRLQIRRETDPAEYIWGEYAARFAKAEG